MATPNQKEKSVMVLAVNGGMNASGGAVKKHLRFSTIRTTATDDAILAVGTEFAGLLSTELISISREDTGRLFNA